MESHTDTLVSHLLIPSECDTVSRTFQSWLSWSNVPLRVMVRIEGGHGLKACDTVFGASRHSVNGGGGNY